MFSCILPPKINGTFIPVILIQSIKKKDIKTWLCHHHFDPKTHQGPGIFLFFQSFHQLQLGYLGMKCRLFTLRCVSQQKKREKNWGEKTQGGEHRTVIRLEGKIHRLHPSFSLRESMGLHGRMVGLYVHQLLLQLLCSLMVGRLTSKFPKPKEGYETM